MPSRRREAAGTAQLSVLDCTRLLHAASLVAYSTLQSITATCTGLAWSHCKQATTESKSRQRSSYTDPLYRQPSLLSNSNTPEMSSMGASLTAALPAPKYTGHEEELRPQQRGPRIVGPGHLDDTQIVLKVSVSDLLPPLQQPHGVFRQFLHIEALLTDRCLSAPALHHTANEQDGDPGTRRTLEMAVHSQRSL